MAITRTKDQATTELLELIEQTGKLKSVRRNGEEHVRWIFATLSFLEDVFGQSSRFYLSFAALPWARPGSFMIGGPGDPWASMNPGAAVEREHNRAYLEQLETAKGFLLAAMDRLNAAASIGQVFEGRNTGIEASEILKVVNLAEFKLRRVIRDTPTKEVEVQDALENLLVGADIAYSREVGGIEYSSKTYKPDFILPQIDLAIDVKLCARQGREKEIISEVNDDILAYRTKYRNIFFVVYDVSLIRDTELFSSSFEQNEDVIVRVVKH